MQKKLCAENELVKLKKVNLSEACFKQSADKPSWNSQPSYCAHFSSSEDQTLSEKGLFDIVKKLFLKKTHHQRARGLCQQNRTANSWTKRGVKSHQTDISWTHTTGVKTGHRQHQNNNINNNKNNEGTVKVTSEQRPLVNIGYKFRVPRMVVVHKFDCT